MTKTTKKTTKKATKSAAKKATKTAKKAATKKAAKTVKAEKGISKVWLATLKALKSGGDKSHVQIAKSTGRDKGNQLRELTDAGLVTTSQYEGDRSHVFTITAKGKKALASN